MKRGMVFGVFDRFHTGHQFFLSEAAKNCDELIVVVTLPEIVSLLKNKVPQNSYEARAAKIKNFNSKYQVVPGDKILGEWQVLKTYLSDHIFLGHDQQGIASELDKLGQAYSFLPYYPRTID